MTRSLLLLTLASFSFAGCNDHPVQGVDYGSSHDSQGGETDSDGDDDGYYLDAADSTDSDGGTGGGGFDISDNRCGDRVVDGGEQCDEGDANADDGACTRQCRIAVCGDGLVYGEGEECDEGDNNGANDVSGTCSAECTVIIL